jgi:hypothetical protein
MRHREKMYRDLLFYAISLIQGNQAIAIKKESPVVKTAGLSFKIN